MDEIISAVISIVVWAFIACTVITIIKGKKGIKPKVNGSKRPVKKDSASGRPVRAAGKMRISSDMTVHDNANDWLSQQLRDERRALRETSAMFEMKMSHMKNCDAELLRSLHEKDCDAEKLRKASRK